MTVLPSTERRPPPNLPAACHAAWRTAVESHAGQLRSCDGRPYITHPETVATVVYELGWPTDVVKMALLHDVLEDSPLSPQALAADHGQQVCDVVQVLTKDKRLPKSDRGPDAKCRLARALPKLGPAVAIVKLVDRAHNMVTAQHLPRTKQAAMVSDVQYFFAPLAHQLGLEKWCVWLKAFCPAQNGIEDAAFIELMKSFMPEAHPSAVAKAWGGNLLSHG